MNFDDWTRRTVLVLLVVFGLLVGVGYQWSQVDKPLPSEGIVEQLSKAFGALAADPGRAIREGRSGFIWLCVAVILLAVALKLTSQSSKALGHPIESPFATSLPFVGFTVVVGIVTFALEAGASAYGWYDYFSLYEPYKTMFTGRIMPGVMIDHPAPYWGGGPFDAFTHTAAGLLICSILLNLALVNWMQIRGHWKGVVCAAITIASLMAYEVISPQPPVEYWNTVFDIMHDSLGAFAAVFAYTYLAPAEWEMR